MKHMLIICATVFALSIYIPTIFANDLSTNYSVGTQYNIDNVLDAIKMVESKNGKYIYGKNGELGQYQIKKIVIDDINRIIGKRIYKYSDALDEKKSREICKLYIEYWSKKRGCYGDIKSMVRIWNGGPNGHKKESTLPYWNKIKEVLNVRN